MNIRLLINELSLMVATIFLFASTFTGNTYIILVELLMIIYSGDKVRELRELSNWVEKLLYSLWYGGFIFMLKTNSYLLINLNNMSFTQQTGLQ